MSSLLEDGSAFKKTFVKELLHFYCVFQSVEEESLNITRRDTFLPFKEFVVSFHAAQEKRMVQELLLDLLDDVMKLAVHPLKVNLNMYFLYFFLLVEKLIFIFYIRKLRLWKK